MSNDNHLDTIEVSIDKLINICSSLNQKISSIFHLNSFNICENLFENNSEVVKRVISTEREYLIIQDQSSEEENHYPSDSDTVSYQMTMRIYYINPHMKR